MCSSKPNITKPDPVQEAKQPDLAAVLNARKKKNERTIAGGGTLLTGASGIDNNTAANTGSTTLLGG